jgi:hypothetical protein
MDSEFIGMADYIVDSIHDLLEMGFENFPIPTLAEAAITPCWSVHGGDLRRSCLERH